MKINKEQEAIDRSLELYPPVISYYGMVGSDLNERYRRVFIDLLFQRDLYLLNRDKNSELILPEEWFKKD